VQPVLLALLALLVLLVPLDHFPVLQLCE